MANYNSIKNAALIAPTTNPDLGSASNRYGNVYLSGNVNIAGTSLTSTNALVPRISTIVYGAGATADDTATDPAGGNTITLNGSGFNYGATLYIGGSIVSIVTVVDSAHITFTSPAKSAGNYTLILVNPDGASATFVPGIQYSGVPAWTTTAGSLGAYTQGTAFSATLAATSDSAVTYSIVSGALPSGITLNSTTGFLSGTMPTVSGSTTYNFTVRATDGEKQDTDRNFSVNVATAPPTGQIAYTTPGTYSWTVPGGVTSISAVVVGGGTGGNSRDISQYAGGGSGAALRYINSVSVTPGETLTILAGAGGTGGSGYGGNGGATSIARGSNVLIKSSQFNGTSSVVGAGTYGGTIGGFDGGAGGSGGGGAGGYAGAGGGGGNPYGVAGTGGAGGGGGGYNLAGGRGGAGGGVGIFGQGANGGAGGTDGNYNGYGGGGGSGGTAGDQTGPGGSYGGGGGGCGSSVPGGGVGGGGAVRIIWGPGRSFPSTLTTDQ